MSKVAVVAGVGALLLYQSGMLDALINPPEDEVEEEEPDLVDGDPNWDIGDPLALLAISMATRAGLKGAAKAVKAATKVKPAALKVQAVKASAAIKPTVAKAATAATKATTTAAKGGVKVATQATEAAATAATKAATTATKAVGPAAKSAAKSAKGAQLMSKLKGTPADLIVMVIAQVLSAVLDLDPDSFRDCEPGEFDLGRTPDYIQAIIGAVPFLGDLFDLLGNKMCLKAGCPKDTEDSGGLCYPPCKPGFKSDGAIMCYRQYPEFESNGMLGTITSITKKILMDTGRIPSDCAEGEEKIGACAMRKSMASPMWQAPCGRTVQQAIQTQGCAARRTGTWAQGACHGSVIAPRAGITMASPAARQSQCPAAMGVTLMMGCCAEYHCEAGVVTRGGMAAPPGVPLESAGVASRRTASPSRAATCTTKRCTAGRWRRARY